MISKNFDKVREKIFSDDTMASILIRKALIKNVFRSAKQKHDKTNIFQL